MNTLRITAIVGSIAAFAPSAHAAAGSLRPFAEYEKARTLLMSGETPFFSASAKRRVLESLPSEVTAILYASKPRELERMKRRFQNARPAGRIEFVLWEGKGWSFWSRDNLPYPLVEKGPSGPPHLALVDSRYHWHYEPDSEVASFFDAPLSAHGYEFEGGNLLADRNANCFIVRGSSDDLPDLVFERQYGCKTLTRLRKVRGIGHVDERIKFLSDQVVATDTSEYAPLLEERGYRVVILPRARLPFESYANSLLVNGTLFMPEFNDPSRDRAAFEAYRAQGLRVVTVPSFAVSNFGQGSIHCMSMTYP